jgi:anti-sigma factor RsiW
MSALDNLPPDQRAVLQMVLQRGRSYDEIASLLSIDRAAVRQRALDGFDALTPATVLPGPERALVTDYLLGQLPDRVAEEVYSFLQASDADRAWAEALAAVLGPLAPGSLPEIPAGAPLGADDGAAGGLEDDSDPPDLGGAEEPGAYAAPVAEEPELRTRPTREPRPPRAPREPRPSSRRGGAILLSTLGVLIVAVIVVVIATAGGGAKNHAHSNNAGSTTTTQDASTTATTGTTTTATTGTGTTGGTTQILAQLNLSSPTGAKATLGIAQVARVDGVLGIVIDAQGVPPNTAHNAYAVWLYSSATKAKFVGFVRNLVGKSGKLSAEGQLPAGASSYRRLLITLETQQKPSAPGEVVLSGPFREHS